MSEYDHLIVIARQSRENAHAPYSNFRVGAALRAVSGRVFGGCNVENASFGLTICAERDAVFRMVRDGRKSFSAIVVYTPTAEPTTPCGACRQVLREFGRDAEVICVCDGPERIETSVAELLPFSFGPERLLGGG